MWHKKWDTVTSVGIALVELEYHGMERDPPSFEQSTIANRKRINAIIFNKVQG